MENYDLLELFGAFEEQHPSPASVVPSIPQGQQLGTVDKLAQSVVPRIVDKLNAACWQVERLEFTCGIYMERIKELYQENNATLSYARSLEERIKALETGKKSASRTRKKKEPEVDITEIADYDPDTDTWVPMVIADQPVTGALIETLAHLGSAAGQMYSDELIQFVGNLDDRVKKAIAAKFPN